MASLGLTHSIPLRRSWIWQLHLVVERRADRSCHRRTMSSATSRDVKQKLVNLLFRDKYTKTGPEGHKRLDFSIYSYEDLRKAYLKRLQAIHPDKINSNCIDDDDDRRRQYTSQIFPKKDGRIHSKEDLKKEFQKLQSTWDRYEELSKSMMKARGDGVAANFTQFGVGCSFSDSEEERMLREEITDQACRGWFSSGLVSSGLTAENDDDGNNADEHTSGSSKSSKGTSSKQKPLIDETMFVHVESSGASGVSDRSNVAAKTDSSRRYRRTLIPGIN